MSQMTRIVVFVKKKTLVGNSPNHKYNYSKLQKADFKVSKFLKKEGIKYKS